MGESGWGCCRGQELGHPQGLTRGAAQVGPPYFRTYGRLLSRLNEEASGSGLFGITSGTLPKCRKCLAWPRPGAQDRS